jgi:3-oxoacyl-[acyl-carrier-protein] synthase-3
MGTKVEAVAVMSGRSEHAGRHHTLAGRAMHECLGLAGVQPDDVGLLLNAGLYHDRNLGEPALAALLQHELGANDEDPHGAGPGTFSFDVANGPCGVLTAFRIADGFLRAGTVERVLVVAGDASPGRRAARRFPFGATAGAALLRWTDTPSGFDAFGWETAPEDADLFEATVALENGRNRLRVEAAPEFEERAALWAAKAASRVLAEAALSADDVDLVLTAPVTPAFVAAVGANLGMAEERFAGRSPAAAPHTAALLFALADAWRDGRFGAARRVLLVAAGAGITAGAALMTNERGSA